MALELGIAFKRWGLVEKSENSLRYVSDEDTGTLTPFSFLLPSCLEKIGFANSIDFLVRYAAVPQDRMVD